MRTTRMVLTVLAIGPAVLLGACADTFSGSNAVGGVTIATVPTRPYLVSGGDVLLRLEGAEVLDLETLDVALNGIDVSDVFHPAPADPLGRETHALLGLVEGLTEGDNAVVVTAGEVPVADLTVTNYPIAGPIFSGEHLAPYFCLEDLEVDRDGEARRFAIGNGDFIIGGALDDDCSLETRVDYLYRSVDDETRFIPLVDVSRPPSDLARLETDDGEGVPYIVRLETGTINRAIYQTAMLVAPDDPDPDPWSPSAGWNGRLVYTFGGGCEAGFFQGTSTGGVLRDNVLSQGYAVASSTLNVNAQGGCNDPLSAETAMMVKEHFAETFGPPVHTIGWGGSGGAMQQLLIAGAYPGILDGILPTLTFPDAISYFIDTAECRLPLRGYLNNADLDDETRRVIGGWAAWDTCDQSLGFRPNRIGPDDCPATIPVEARYHQANNPDGVRCSIYDGMRSVFGTRVYDEIAPATVAAFGRSPHDNVGVQYGLEALNRGRIEKSLFLDLNAGVGGWDIDFAWRPERATADLDAVRIAYETGRVTSGGGGLAVTPIIDERNYLDDVANFHTSYYSFVMRERLIRDNGHADNYVIQRRRAPLSRADDNLALMNEWLGNIALDTVTTDPSERVVKGKPVTLTDSCWNDDGIEIVEPQRFDTDRLYDNTNGRCNELFPVHTGPRMIAGGPLTNDVLKCELKPLDPGDYDVTFTVDEWTRLGRIFPDGVCDWSKPGIGQQPNTRTWLSFGPSPINRYEPAMTN